MLGNKDSYCEVLEKGFATVHPDSRELVAYPIGHQEGFPDAFKQCFTQVYNSLDNPNAPRDFATAADGWHEMVLCDKIFESSQKQQWVEVQAL